MLIRFTTPTAEYVMEQSGPFGHIPPNTPASEFLAFVGSSYQEKITVARATLISGARALHEHLTSNRHVLAYRYSCAVPKKSMLIKGGGGCSGIKIDGQFHSLWCGNGECYLLRYEVQEDGTGREAERIDVRDRKTIQTDDWGVIKISRRKIEFSLPETLADCIRFLESVSDDEIDLYSYDKPPTIHDIVREFEEGCGGDDWAIEEVCRDSSRWRIELFDALRQKRWTKHRATIVQLLLLCFPDAETRSEVAKTIDGFPKKTRTELLLLLAAFGEMSK